MPVGRSPCPSLPLSPGGRELKHLALLVEILEAILTLLRFERRITIAALAKNRHLILYHGFLLPFSLLGDLITAPTPNFDRSDIDAAPLIPRCRDPYVPGRLASASRSVSIASGSVYATSWCAASPHLRAPRSTETALDEAAQTVPGASTCFTLPCINICPMISLPCTLRSPLSQLQNSSDIRLLVGLHIRFDKTSKSCCGSVPRREFVERV
mmetsp:Transcript_27826/g.64788  ORF Transcript_27826/g.64788 Transcript_27826/m.64788 type:complete len:212 (-) Transcript_27826:177-812(-)